MPLDIDGTAVLRAITNAPEIFKDVDKDLTEFAHKVVVKQLKAKGTTVDQIRSIYRVVGGENFGLIADSLPDGGKAILAKVDKHNPDLGAADTARLREHLVGLARGTIDAVAKQVGTQKASRTKQAAGRERKAKTPAKRAISAKAYEATWDGKNRDD
ncbi:hypothetical protein PQJ75_20135 [Rhodoplanes sp. TEM]|uniref:Uncharacterized protein n=1 Tax=Rhodoplanes tepidamans TaxID=200616 RepID=A0ABT5J5F3_RHOTP|nr:MULTISPECIES: hypothetical protein [Rhodoplanes]MDC7784859.1 hypothetical protein [Rhodoplanes tepidamans]MDC7986045.1 hypothetical protein [Rhodoplanes sp. TEM]MDQ0353914.1 hypothetical protein [Rhodoplanes tepidamans]